MLTQELTLCCFYQCLSPVAMETGISLFYLPCFLFYIDSVIVTCTLESVIVYPCLPPLIFLDLLSDIVMAMQNKQTVLIVGAFSVGPCLRLL